MTNRKPTTAPLDNAAHADLAGRAARGEIDFAEINALVARGRKMRNAEIRAFFRGDLTEKHDDAPAGATGLPGAA